MDVSQMQNIMGSSNTQSQPQSQGKTMTVAQMQQIMNSGAPNPNQSAATLGHSTGILTSLLSTGGAIVGGIGGAALGGLAGIETGPGAIGTAYLGGVAGAGAGGAAGEALGEKIETGSVDTGKVAETGGINALLEGIGGPLASLGGKVLEKTALPVVKTVGAGLSKVGEMFGAKPAAEAVEQTVAARPLNVATKRLASTAENMTKAEREAAIKEGRMTPKGKYTPSATEQRAGEIMKSKTYSNPVKTVKAVQNEISTRGAEAEQYLEQNAQRITNKEDMDAFNSARASSEKYMTPTEAKAYDEQIGVFQKILKNYSNLADGGYTTPNYYRALKDYESQVTANIPKGKEALLQPGGAARIQAAKDVRSVVRNMIGEKNPEFKGKMYDLASLYDSLDNVVANAEAGGASFSKRHPFVTKAAEVGAGVAGYEELKKTPLGNLLP